MAQRNERRAANSSQALGEIGRRLATLTEMTVNDLREAFEEVYGFATNSRNRVYLLKRVAWKIQADADGGLSQRALDRIEELAPLAPVRWRPNLKDASVSVAQVVSRATSAGKQAGNATRRDPRLPKPETILTRGYRGREHQVVVLDEGFQYEGRPYSSLSHVAREITGTNWNGFLFFKESLNKASGACA